MALHGRGLICLPWPPERCDQLSFTAGLPHEHVALRHGFLRIYRRRRRRHHRHFRGRPRHTIRVAMRPETKPPTCASRSRFPLARARRRGASPLPVRREAAVDLARLAAWSRAA